MDEPEANGTAHVPDHEPDAIGAQRTAAEHRAVAGWSFEAWERENEAAIAQIAPVTDEDLVRLDRQRVEAEGKRSEEFSVRWRVKRDAQRLHKISSLAALVAFGPAGTAVRASQQAQVPEYDWPLVLRAAQRVSSLPIGRRPVLTVGVERGRRAPCGSRRRPGVRRTVSRSAGGGSSGDPDEPEPAEHGRRPRASTRHEARQLARGESARRGGASL